MPRAVRMRAMMASAWAMTWDSVILVTRGDFSLKRT